MGERARTVFACGLAGACLVAVAAATPSSPRAGLPSVAEGPPPGPAVLYAEPATSPLLDNTGRWQAEPLLVSGSWAYRAGEFLYTDFLYDDRGANTTDLYATPPEPRPPSTSLLFGPMTGDLVYPTDDERFGHNAADLVELRIRLDDDVLAYRITLNTLLAEGTTAVAIGISRDDGTEVTDWGHGIGALGPLGLDHVVYTDGLRAELDGVPVATSTDLARNQIEVVIPRDVVDPGTATWRHYAVVGIADGDGGFAPVEQQPTADRPGGAALVGGLLQGPPPPVFNVGFRSEADGAEPMGLFPPQLGPRSPAGWGHWREHGQALALAARDISAFGADVDFGAMARGEESTNAPQTGFMNRIYASSLGLGEGVADGRPWLLGQLQPYAIYVPTSYDPSEPAPLLLVLHSLSATHNQFEAISPSTYRDLAEARGAIAVTPMGRGPDNWYQREGEFDVFEVWADVARHYNLDPDRVAMTGYSMGGYGSFKLAAQYPDLFARIFPVVGPPAEGIVPAAELDFTTSPETNTTHILDNLRNIPVLSWVGVADELVPITSTITHADVLHRLGYRHNLDVFTSDHFALGFVDDWTRALPFLEDDLVDRDPPHVTYRVMPASDAPDLGLVHDKAYWLWGIEARERVAEPATGLVDAYSRGFGVGDADTSDTYGAGPDPLPYVRRGLAWGALPEVPVENVLELRLENVAAVTLGVARARLDPSDELTIETWSDGSTVVSLHGAFPAGSTVVADGEAVPAVQDADGLRLVVEAGERTYVVVPGVAHDPRPSLPATGGGLAVAGLLALAVLGRRRVRSS